VSDTAQVAVIGAGITGLTIAHGLARRGIGVRLLEARSRPGGVIETQHRDGFLLEQGPFSVMVRSGTFGELLAELGLEPIEVDAGGAKNRYVLRGGSLRPVPTSPGALLRTTLLSPRARVRLLAGVVRSRPRPQGADETLAQVATRRLGREAAEFLAGPAAVGIFGAEADELSFDAAIPAFASADREGGSVIGMMKSVKRSRRAAGGPAPVRRAMISFDGGLETLIAALARSVGAGLVLGARVLGVQREGSGFRISHEAGQFTAEAVVVAAGPSVASRLVAPLVPVARQELDAVRSGGLGVVHLGFRRADVAHPLDGFGFLIPRSEPVPPLLGAIWASSVFRRHAPDGHVLVRAIVGGTRWPDALHWTEGELIARSFAALEPILGFRADPVLAQARAWPGCVPVYSPGHLDRVSRVADAVGRVPGLWCTGNWVGGLGVNDRVAAGRTLAAEVAHYVGALASPARERMEIAV
jgi:oxygen-dependent protoporphyrinogen oxidase